MKIAVCEEVKTRRGRNFQLCAFNYGHAPNINDNVAADDAA